MPDPAPRDARSLRRRDLFDRAMELPAPERAAFARAAAGDDPALVHELLDLITRANGGSRDGPATPAPGDVFRQNPLGGGFNLLDVVSRDQPAPPSSRPQSPPAG